MISSFLLVPDLVPGVVSLLVSFLSPFLSLLSLLTKGVCSIMISCFLLVPARVPGLVSLLVLLLVSSSFAQKGRLFHHDFLFLAGSGSGSGACLPSCLPSCLFFLCSKKEAVPSWFPASCWFRLWFRGLSPFLFCFLSLLPLLKNGGCSIMISCFLLVPALVPGLVSLLVLLLVSSSFAQKWRLFHHDFLFLAGSGSGSGACLPSCLFLVSLLVSFFAQERSLFHHDFQLLAGSGSGSGASLLSCLASCLA